MYEEELDPQPQEGGGMPWGGMAMGGALGAAALGHPLARTGLRSAATAMGHIPKAGPMMARGAEGMARGGDAIAGGVDAAAGMMGGMGRGAMQGLSQASPPSVRSAMEQAGTIPQRMMGAAKNMMKAPAESRFKGYKKNLAGTVDNKLLSAAETLAKKAEGGASAAEANKTAVKSFMTRMTNGGADELAKKAAGGDKQAAKLMGELEELQKWINPGA